MPLTLSELNRLDADRFTEALAAIFEHSPWIPARTFARRPFDSIAALHQAMCQTLHDAEPDDQLRLIRAHPKLAGKAAIRGELTDASRQEQSGAGLDQCSPEEFALISALNEAYDEHFGFPFILAVRGHDRQSIIANMQARIGNERDVEHGEALRQIERIAALRLHDMLTPAPLR